MTRNLHVSINVRGAEALVIEIQKHFELNVQQLHGGHMLTLNVLDVRRGFYYQGKPDVVKKVKGA